MNELIKINWSNIGDSECRTVDARELWYFLETKYRFTEWIKQRIHTYEFVAGTDYEVFRESPINKSGGRPQDNYHITINMAKQLCMVENNDKDEESIDPQPAIGFELISDFEPSTYYLSPDSSAGENDVVFFTWEANKKGNYSLTVENFPSQLTSTSMFEVNSDFENPNGTDDFYI